MNKGLTGLEQHGVTPMFIYVCVCVCVCVNICMCFEVDFENFSFSSCETWFEIKAVKWTWTSTIIWKQNCTFPYSLCNNKQMHSGSQSFINPVLCSTLALHAHKAT